MEEEQNEDDKIIKILKEIKKEQHPIEDDATLKGYINKGIFDINENAGTEIDYEKDLKARQLLENYVLYSRFNRLAEFKQIYGGEYTDVQAKYYKSSDI